MRPQRVLIPEHLPAPAADGLLLRRVTDLEVLLQVGTVADELVAYGAGTRLIRVVFCRGHATVSLRSLS